MFVIDCFMSVYVVAEGRIDYLDGEVCNGGWRFLVVYGGFQIYM